MKPIKWKFTFTLKRKKDTLFCLIFDTYKIQDELITLCFLKRVHADIGMFFDSSRLLKINK